MMIPFPLGQEKLSPPLSPNHSPLSPTRIVRKPAEPPAEADAVPVASNPQVGAGGGGESLGGDVESYCEISLVEVLNMMLFWRLAS